MPMKLPETLSVRLITRIISALVLVSLLFTLHWAHRTDHALQRAGRIYHVDPLLLRAIGMRESRLNPKARGAAGEIGMFQIMPNTAKHWAEVVKRENPTEEQLFRVSLNAEICAWYIRRGLDRFDHQEDPLPFALAFYNAGPSRAVRWEKELPEHIEFTRFIPFPSTRAYVTSILEDYRGMQGGGSR